MRLLVEHEKQTYIKDIKDLKWNNIEVQTFQGDIESTAFLVIERHSDTLQKLQRYFAWVSVHAMAAKIIHMRMQDAKSFVVRMDFHSQLSSQIRKESHLVLQYCL